MIIPDLIKPCKKPGFTLIEVLAGMAVLLILTLALIRVFNESAAAFQRGNTTVARNSQARAVLEVIRRDLEGMVVDERATLAKGGDLNLDVEGNICRDFDGIAFMTLAGKPIEPGSAALADANQPAATRSYQAIYYYVRYNKDEELDYGSFQLMRGVHFPNTIRRPSLNPPTNRVDLLGVDTVWWNRNRPAAERMLNNVVRFDIWACNEEGRELSSFSPITMFNADTYQVRYTSLENMQLGPGQSYPSNTPPAYLDIYLQVASDDAMRKAWLAFQGGNSQQAWSILYRDSSVLWTRVVPRMADAQRRQPYTY
ncbi:MAG: prepilin-type N-terminal cleavage/methylation domain-containing protein [Kiritimatiellae bacterium]|nr:prepilin-type N-terminal cleavage/methylation domain-containing protein [Kiritimatiellia bacterium]